jgi:hypothetical protein
MPQLSFGGTVSAQLKLFSKAQAGPPAFSFLQPEAQKQMKRISAMQDFIVNFLINRCSVDRLQQNSNFADIQAN